MIEYRLAIPCIEKRKVAFDYIKYSKSKAELETIKEKIEKGELDIEDVDFDEVDDIDILDWWDLELDTSDDISIDTIEDEERVILYKTVDGVVVSNFSMPLSKALEEIKNQANSLYEEDIITKEEQLLKWKTPSGILNVYSISKF